MKDRFHLTFVGDQVFEPVVCMVAKQFDVTFSIRRASVDSHAGWLDLQLEGSDEEIERAIAFMESKGVRVDPIEGDIIAG
jgi:L-aspartate semialdehyde sulfurtransferase ferredoxin